MKGLIEILLFILLVGHPEAGVTLSEDKIDPTPTPQATQVLGSATTSSIVSSINSIRSSHGLKQLRQLSVLNRAATNRACYLYKNQIWSHEGEGYVRFFAQVGYLTHPKWIGENLARYFNNDAEVVQGWVQSPRHMQNILDAGFVNVGTGKCGDYVVVFFGGN